jgi:hypothetical protein
MTEAHWRLYETALGQVIKWSPIAPHGTAPYDRPENREWRRK